MMHFNLLLFHLCEFLSTFKYNNNLKIRIFHSIVRPRPTSLSSAGTRHSAAFSATLLKSVSPLCCILFPCRVIIWLARWNIHPFVCTAVHIWKQARSPHADICCCACVWRHRWSVLKGLFLSRQNFSNAVAGTIAFTQTWNNGNIEESNSLVVVSSTSSFPPTRTTCCPCGGGCDTNPGRELRDWFAALCPSWTQQVVKWLVNKMHEKNQQSGNKHTEAFLRSQEDLQPLFTDCNLPTLYSLFFTAHPPSLVSPNGHMKR